MGSTRRACWLSGQPSARLVLVDAPAGFGKTTLIAQWHLSPAESRPFAWISLDSGDDDPGRLWWHIVSALGALLRVSALTTSLPCSGPGVLTSPEPCFRFLSVSWAG